MTPLGGAYDTKVEENLLAGEADSGIMKDNDEKNFKLRDAQATFWSEVSTHFGFYNIDATNKIFTFMYVIYAFYILQ